jgi:hypothetical protein
MPAATRSSKLFGNYPAYRCRGDSSDAFVMVKSDRIPEKRTTQALATKRSRKRSSFPSGQAVGEILENLLAFVASSFPAELYQPMLNFAQCRISDRRTDLPAMP